MAVRSFWERRGRRERIKEGIIIIYNTFILRNGEAEGAVSESHLIFSSRRRSVSSKVQRAAASPRCH